MHKSLTALSLILLSFPIFAATEIDLSKQEPTFLLNKTLMEHGVNMVETSRASDFNNTLHIRLLETYRGYPVWNGESIVHIPQQGKSMKTALSLIDKHASMDGSYYQHLQKDLASTPAFVFSNKQLAAAIQHIITTARLTGINSKHAQRMIYLDDNHKAHWAFELNINIAGAANQLPQHLIYIVDAKDFTIYEKWNDIKTHTPFPEVTAGGFAGNHKTGKKILDGLTDKGHFANFLVQREDATNSCYMRNSKMRLIDWRTKKTMQFSCPLLNPEYNNIYWNGNHDQVDTTWSPSNDVMFGLDVAIQMYQDWYNLPVLQDSKGQLKFIPVFVHDPITNAYWDEQGGYAVFGNSQDDPNYNPFTQLDTVVHEISHGFVTQHSHLRYTRQSGGMNEAFADMAGIAGEYYAYGKTDFLIGVGDVSAEGKALRYMDQPSKDCGKRKPGNKCSIDNFKQYFDGLNVHYSSGIYNRVYYHLAHLSDWDAKKAFDVMVQANIAYWRANTDFEGGACDVKRAARDYKYNTKDIDTAFNVVGIDTSNCRMKQA